MSFLTSVTSANCCKKCSPPSEEPAGSVAMVSCFSARLRMSSKSSSSNRLFNSRSSCLNLIPCQDMGLWAVMNAHMFCAPYLRIALSSWFEGFSGLRGLSPPRWVCEVSIWLITAANKSTAFKVGIEGTYWHTPKPSSSWPSPEYPPPSYLWRPNDRR